MYIYDCRSGLSVGRIHKTNCSPNSQVSWCITHVMPWSYQVKTFPLGVCVCPSVCLFLCMYVCMYLFNIFSIIAFSTFRKWWLIWNNQYTIFFSVIFCKAYQIFLYINTSHVLVWAANGKRRSFVLTRYTLNKMKRGNWPTLFYQMYLACFYPWG